MISIKYANIFCAVISLILRFFLEKPNPFSLVVGVMFDLI